MLTLPYPVDALALLPKDGSFLVPNLVSSALARLMLSRSKHPLRMGLEYRSTHRLHNLPWRATALSSISRHNYATSKTSNDEGGHNSAPRSNQSRPPIPDHVLCGSVTAVVDTNQLTPADILASIYHHDLRTVKPIRRPTHNKLFGVFLLTKAFATWATDEDFIRDALTKVLRDTANPAKQSPLPPLQLELLVACVDAIPSPGETYMKETYWGDRNAILQNLEEYKEKSLMGDAMKATPVHDHGAEGFAYCVSAHELQVPFETVEDEVPSQDGPRHTKNLTPATQGTISFVMKDLRNPSPASRRLKLPLAKTIFHNGYPHTLHSSSWIENNATERFELVQQQAHEHASVTIPLEVLNEDRPLLKKSWHITTPLIPLTPPREVTASMGNIVRHIGGEDVPASHELETAVVQFFEDNDMPVQAAAVWALVIPRETAAQLEVDGTLDLMHMDKERERQRIFLIAGRGEERLRDVFSSVPYLLMLRGARLHKVLSGGGGWGKKAGLLSLDPESDYSSIDPTAPARNIDLDGLINEPSPVKEVASPGDFIRFYIYPNLPEEAFAFPLRDLQRRSTNRVQGLEFGVLPSTMDDMDSLSSTQDGAANSAKTLTARFCERQFGALSEGGMSVEITDNDGIKTTSSKVDVPYARFSYQHYAYGYSREFLEERLVLEEEQAKQKVAEAAIQKERKTSVSNTKKDPILKKKDNLISKLQQEVARLKSARNTTDGVPLRKVLTARLTAETMEGSTLPSSPSQPDVTIPNRQKDSNEGHNLARPSGSQRLPAKTREHKPQQETPIDRLIKRYYDQNAERDKASDSINPIRHRAINAHLANKVRAQSDQANKPEE